jgi:hypothetical protein
MSEEQGQSSDQAILGPHEVPYNIPQNLEREVTVANPPVGNPNYNVHNMSTSTEHVYRDFLAGRNYPAQYRNHEGWDLLRAIGLYNHGISYNPFLTTPHTAQQWLSAKQQAKNKLLNYSIVTEDLDNNSLTPDDVIIVDHRRIPRFVDGYHFRDPQNRNKASMFYNLYQTRNQARQTS